ncbi:8-oxo-dGTP diphosphatase MutT [Gayadomonas joobiniege]|uniref:8-oxo-dGTP diphosphatase MutT n=1 Tax=Gayadomonas joobiniege TaxID=1234606 RepID=UPI000377F656|nr:8-oxo-dGTP diphosphatase MutT [Gayadomonas joobiniege]
MKQVHVAVAVVFNRDQQILIAKRADHQHQGGFWEFPGGKVEADENVTTALKRELLEECGIELADCQPLIKISHDYGDKQVILDTWVCRHFSGQASGKEGQPIKWVSLEELYDHQFPPANLEIIQALNKLPKA